MRKLLGDERLLVADSSAHLAAEHLAPYAERLVALRAVEKEADGTNTAQA